MSKKSLHPCFFCKNPNAVHIECAEDDDGSEVHFALCGECGACGKGHADRKAALDQWLDIHKKLTEIK